MELGVKPAESDEEFRLASDLIASVFADSDSATRSWFENSWAKYPGTTREHTRIALSKGKLAGTMRIQPETMRLGEARLRVGGLAWIATAPRYRGEGVGRCLMQDALNYLRHHAYHLALLFGGPNIYYPFGFVTALADYVVGVDTIEALSFQTVSKVRPTKPGDIVALQKMHSANDAHVPCSLLRSSAHFTNKWQQRGSSYVLTDSLGRPVAYFFTRVGDDGLWVEEVGVSEPKVCPDVLGACGARAADSSAGRIRFLVPPTHPFARFLGHVRSVHETHVLRDGGGMLACVDIGEMLESMVPEWENLLQRSAARELRTETTLVVEGETYRIRANRGAVDIAAFPGRNKLGLQPGELTHLITGYCYLEDILASCRSILSGEARTLLKALFPKRNPYVWHFDRF